MKIGVIVEFLYFRELGVDCWLVYDGWVVGFLKKVEIVELGVGIVLSIYGFRVVVLCYIGGFVSVVCVEFWGGYFCEVWGFEWCVLVVGDVL